MRQRGTAVLYKYSCDGGTLSFTDIPKSIKPKCLRLMNDGGTLSQLLKT